MIGIILVLTITIGLPLGTYAVQNIFTGFGQITDIQYGGNNIDRVVYQGEVIWERIPAMQDFTSAQCSALSPGATIQLRDTRDNKTYRIRKMADSRCWMIDDLAYDINSAPPTGKPAYATTPEYDSTPSGTPNLTSVTTKPQYAQNTSVYNIPNNGSSTPTYLYNWCAAMGDTSANCTATRAYGAGQPATSQTGICPAPFRLPIGGAEPTTPGNGANRAAAAATTTSEFAKLDIWMGGTGTNRPGAASSISKWLGTANTPDNFSALRSGAYNSGLYSQGHTAAWWASTAYATTDAHDAYFYRTDDILRPAAFSNKHIAYTVRCIAM